MIYVPVWIGKDLATLTTCTLTHKEIFRSDKVSPRVLLGNLNEFFEQTKTLAEVHKWILPGLPKASRGFLAKTFSSRKTIFELPKKSDQSCVEISFNSISSLNTCEKVFFYRIKNHSSPHCFKSVKNRYPMVTYWISQHIFISMERSEERNFIHACKMPKRLELFAKCKAQKMLLFRRESRYGIVKRKLYMSERASGWGEST